MEGVTKYYDRKWKVTVQRNISKATIPIYSVNLFLHDVVKSYPSLRRF